MSQLEDYYDRLTPYYTYIYRDWENSLLRQAETLNRIIHEYFGSGVKTILDAACGIGTQCLGLAQQGYEITASDISSGEVQRARSEAQRRGLNITFETADMCDLWQHYRRTFDLVIACDNAIPHLLSDAQILEAFNQFYRCSTPEGGCMISVRDYAALTHSASQLNPRNIHETPSGKLILFDHWKFDGDYYDMTTYVVEDKGQPEAITQVIPGGRYYCIKINRLEALLLQAGFKRVFTLRECYFQPLLVATKK
ncbi:MAG: class I SAM-dependent methyltransferase [Anaerolineae bacterium]|nr:class I SAM-dependent methyltransferase [Anaerolineae bacterium]